MTPLSASIDDSFEFPATLLWDCRTAAKALSISERTLWSLTKAGKIPHVPNGRRVLYNPNDLREWIKARRQGPRIDEANE